MVKMRYDAKFGGDR